MKRFPSGVQKYTPSARATAIGATFFCAVHSKIVCFFESATISSLVIDIRSPVEVFLKLFGAARSGQRQHEQDPGFVRAQVVGADAAEFLRFDVASVEWNNAACVNARAEHYGYAARTHLLDRVQRTSRHVAEPEPFDDEPAQTTLLKQQGD